MKSIEVRYVVKTNEDVHVLTKAISEYYGDELQRIDVKEVAKSYF